MKWIMGGEGGGGGEALTRTAATHAARRTWRDGKDTGCSGSMFVPEYRATFDLPTLSELCTVRMNELASCGRQHKWGSFLRTSA